MFAVGGLCYSLLYCSNKKKGVLLLGLSGDRQGFCGCMKKKLFFSCLCKNYYDL